MTSLRKANFSWLWWSYILFIVDFDSLTVTITLIIIYDSGDSSLELMRLGHDNLLDSWRGELLSIRGV